MSYDLYPAVDDDLQFPPEIREALAASIELRSQVVPMNQTARNNLTGDELWDNRIIFNTTTDRMDRYDLSSTTWVQITTEPAGVIKAYGGAVAPAYHVMADGSLVSRTGIYAALFAVYGTTYNTGGEDGSHFRLPNLLGRVPVGHDPAQALFDTLGETGGETGHVLTGGEMPSHGHTGNTGAEGTPHTHALETKDITPGSLGGGGGSLVREGYVGLGSGRNTGTESAAHGHPFTTDAAGGGAAHNNMQPYISLNYIITL